MKSLAFIMDRSTFGQGEVDSKEPTAASVASYRPAYWIAVGGVLPGLPEPVPPPNGDHLD